MQKDINKEELIYEGKAKRLYKTDDKNLAIMQYKDDMTAFNAKIKKIEDGKGAINCKTSTIIFNYLKKHNIKTHLIKKIDDTKQLVKILNIVKLEFIIRNISAGSIVKRLGLKENIKFNPPILELSYKDDELGDPLLNDEHAVFMKLVKNLDELNMLKDKTREINNFLIKFFDEIGLILVDFKVEFGFDKNRNIFLGDEISLDNIRVWTKNSHKKMDKDRFRLNLGDVQKSYRDVLNLIEGRYLDS